MDRGDLVSDEIMVKIIPTGSIRPIVPRGSFWTAFPAPQLQAEALDVMLHDKGLALDHVIEMTVDDSILVDRISGRYTCAKCGEGYHDHFKKPKVADTCDRCGSHEFKRRPDDRADTVSIVWMSITPRPPPVTDYRAKNALKSVDDGWPALTR